MLVGFAKLVDLKLRVGGGGVGFAKETFKFGQSL